MRRRGRAAESARRSRLTLARLPGPVSPGEQRSRCTAAVQVVKGREGKVTGEEALAAGVDRNMPEGRLDVRRQQVVAGPQQLGQRTDVLAGRRSLDRRLVQSAERVNHSGFAGTCGMHAGAREEASATRRQVHVRSPRASLFLIGKHKGHVRRVHQARTQTQLAHGAGKFHLDPLRQPALHERWGRLQGVQPPGQRCLHLGPVKGPCRAGGGHQPSPAREEALDAAQHRVLLLFAPGMTRQSMARSRRGVKRTRSCRAP